jgi:hypothetical protein
LKVVLLFPHNFFCPTYILVQSTVERSGERHSASPPELKEPVLRGPTRIC